MPLASDRPRRVSQYKTLLDLLKIPIINDSRACHGREPRITQPGGSAWDSGIPTKIRVWRVSESSDYRPWAI